MATATHRSFADTAVARLIALLIAVAIAVLFVFNWSDEAEQLLAGTEPGIPIIEQQVQVRPVNADLQNCLDQRVGDVEKMKSEGVINDAQYTSFRQRAEDLCRAQHPG
jgi:competence protein ComGC